MGKIDLSQLKYVIEVAKHKSFTRAADECYLAQSSLSAQISKLETELGVRIFRRTPRSIELTKAGEVVLEFAKKMTESKYNLQHCLRKYNSPEHGSLTIGLLPGSATTDYIEYIGSYKFNYPNVSISIYEGICDELIKMLASNKVDIALLTDHEPSSAIKEYLFYEEEVVLVVGKNHPLANRTEISLHEIADTRLIGPKDSPILQYSMPYIVKELKNRNLDTTLKFYTTYNTHFITNVGLVVNGWGAELLTRSNAEKLKSWGLSILKLQPSFNRHFYLAISNDAYDFPVIQGFVKYIIEAKKSKQKHKDDI